LIHFYKRDVQCIKKDVTLGTRKDDGL